MRICFFSDIHGNILAFESFVRQAKEQKIDKWVFGGDAIGYYYHADEVIDYLRTHEIKCLLGNHDKMFLELSEGVRDEKELIKKYGDSYCGIASKIKQENVEFLKSLDSSYEVNVNGCKLGFFHGGPRDFLNMRIYPDTLIDGIRELEKYDFVFTGHTHHKLVRAAGACTIINPGSVGQQRDGRGCSYIIFDTGSKSVQFYTIEYAREELVNEIKRLESQERMRERLIEVLFREADKNN